MPTDTDINQARQKLDKQKQLLNKTPPVVLPDMMIHFLKNQPDLILLGTSIINFKMAYLMEL